MKKSKKPLGLLLAAATALAMLPVGGMVNAFAAEKTTIFANDAFEDDVLSTNKWKTDLNEGSDAIKIYSVEGIGHIEYYYNLEEYVFGSANKIEGLKTLQFDYQAPPSGQWSGITLSSTNSNAAVMGNYAVEIVIAGGGYTNHSGNLTSDAETKPSGHAHMPDQWYTLKLEVTSPTTADLYCGAQGQALSKETTVTFRSNREDSACSFDNLYFTIGTCGGGHMGLDNIIVESDNVNFTEDFNDKNFTEELRGYGGGTYTYVKPSSYLQVKEAKKGENVTYAKALSAETSIIESLEVLNATFNASFKNAQSDKLAFAFGISKDSKDYEDGAYMAVMDKEGVYIAYNKDGVETALTEKKAITKLGTEDGAAMNIVANKNGTVTIKADGKAILSVDLTDAAFANLYQEHYYTGHFGFVATQDNAGEVILDNFKLSTVNYKVPTTKSVSHDFSNDYFGNPGFEDFAVNEEPKNSQYVKDGRLVWDGASDNTYFGSAHEYDDFILDFKICNIYHDPSKTDAAETTAVNRWLGLDVGKATSTETAYGTNLMLAFYVVPSTDEISIWTWWNDIAGKTTAEKEEFNKGVTQNKKIPASLLRDITYDGETTVKDDIKESDALCVRYVAEGGTMRIYMKKACEAKYTLYCTIENVETTGYMSLCCTGFMYMEFDDFSMSNISNVYVNAETYTPETIYKETTKVVYGNGDVEPDTNAIKEAAANAAGCASTVGVGLAIVPLMAAGFVMMNKKRGDND